MQFWLDPIDQVDFCMHSKSSSGLAHFVSLSIVNNLASVNSMFSLSYQNLIKMILRLQILQSISYEADVCVTVNICTVFF